ncbi:MAG: phytoene desaturase [Gammaproteobacteria bacterium]|nr:phytoene desaturase [Gammaproteobacteria bacterium]
MAPSSAQAKKVLVIGGGLGGLSAAISLATEGFAVTLVEKNDKLGGKLNVLHKDGFTFDLGPSILTMPHIFEALFTRAGRRMADYLTLQPVLPHWRNFFEDGTVFDLTPDRAAMDAELARVAPDDAAGFYRFLEYSRKLCALTEEGYFARGLDSFWDLVKFYGPVRSLLGFDVFRSMDQGVRRFVTNDKLVDTLNYFIKYVGSSPYASPALMNLLPHIQFGYGLWYVQGGMYQLAAGLERLARELGVVVHLDTEILEIQHAGQRVSGALTADGARFDADIVVSNMEVIPALRRLLKADEAALRPLRKFAPSCSGLVLHLGVDRRYPQLAHHNFFYSRDSKAHFDAVFRSRRLSDDPTIYLVAPCQSDPGQAPAGCEVIKALPHIPAIDARQPLTRDDYLAFRDRVLAKLERMGLADLRRHIVCEETWTPLDIEAKYYSNQGSIYGVVTDRFSNLGFKAPQRSGSYRNLYFVGGSVNPGGGMPMVTLSGQLVRDKILQDLGAA